MIQAAGAYANFSVGDEVAGLLPLDAECPGCAEYCIVPQHCLVAKPPGPSHADCAACLRGGVMAYTALSYQVKLEAGAVVLLCSALQGERLAMLQFCDLIGAKVRPCNVTWFRHLWGCHVTLPQQL